MPLFLIEQASADRLRGESPWDHLLQIRASVNVLESWFSILHKDDAFFKLSILVKRGSNNRDLWVLTSVSRKVVIKYPFLHAYAKRTQYFPLAIDATNLVFPSPRCGRISETAE
jgi:hypothetical protein